MLTKTFHFNKMLRTYYIIIISSERKNYCNIPIHVRTVTWLLCLTREKLCSVLTSYLDQPDQNSFELCACVHINDGLSNLTLFCLHFNCLVINEMFVKLIWSLRILWLEISLKSHTEKQILLHRSRSDASYPVATSEASLADTLTSLLRLWQLQITL